jgi:uncharacterized protein YkwD
MARSAIASTTAALSLLIAAAVPLTAGAASSHAKGHCKAAHSASAPRSATRSYRTSGCAKRGARTHRQKTRKHYLFFTPHDGVCPDTTVQPTAHNVAVVRASTLCLVNRERAAHGERALHWNGHLLAAAQSHTESMAFHGYFAHIGRSGETPLMRMRRAGYIYSSGLGFEVGENIGWGSLWLGTPKAIVAAWMASAGHRANILDPHFRETGIGISPHLGSLDPGQDGGIYTPDFGVITG